MTPNKLPTPPFPKLWNILKYGNYYTDLAEKITEISQDGEDDIFNIKSADDAVNFPNLKKVTLFYDDVASILEIFKEKGISAAWL